MTSEEESARWQPVLLIAQHRIECTTCGSLASIFVQLIDEEISADGEPAYYYYWVPCCQVCWEKAEAEVKSGQ